MTVSLETEGAAAIVDVLAGAAGRPDRGAVEEALEAAELFCRFYESMGVDRELLVGAVRDEPGLPEGEPLDSLRTGFRTVEDSPELVRDRLATLAATDVDALAGRVRRYLPADVPLSTTVHATVDGYNGGFQFQGAVGVSVVGPTAGELETVLPHELHHAGLYAGLRDTPVGHRAFEAEGAAADALQLLVRLLAEGLAIHLAQGGLDAFESEAVTEAVRTYRDRTAETVATVADGLRTVLAGETPAARAEGVASLQAGETELLTPLHFVGAHLVAAGTAVHGVEPVVERATAPGELLRLCDRALGRRDEPRLGPQLVDRLAATVPAS